MTRILPLLVVFALGGIAAVLYLYATGMPSIRAELPAANSPPTADAAAAKDSEVAASTSDITIKTSAVTAQEIAQWIAETEDDDPAVRAAAIDALAHAPKSKALPALIHVMRSGIDNDRQLALNSLHTLALQQGDANDEIRTALRLQIYDGDDETISSSAQIALEDIEHDLVNTSNPAR